MGTRSTSVKSLVHLVQHKETHVAHGDHPAVDEIRQSSSGCWEIHGKMAWSTRKFISVNALFFHCKGEKYHMIQMVLNKNQGANDL
jgi:hypothetical protein